MIVFCFLYFVKTPSTKDYFKFRLRLENKGPIFYHLPFFCWKQICKRSISQFNSAEAIIVSFIKFYGLPHRVPSLGHSDSILLMRPRLVMISDVEISMFLSIVCPIFLDLHTTFALLPCTMLTQQFGRGNFALWGGYHQVAFEICFDNRLLINSLYTPNLLTA